VPPHDHVRRMVRIGELGGRIRKWAAAKLGQADHPLELDEELLELTARGVRRTLCGRGEHLEHRLVESVVSGDDQPVLTAEALVERPLRVAVMP
jgi:hypothetical protein